MLLIVSHAAADSCFPHASPGTGEVTTVSSVGWEGGVWRLSGQSTAGPGGGLLWAGACLSPPFPPGSCRSPGEHGLCASRAAAWQARASWGRIPCLRVRSLGVWSCPSQGSGQGPFLAFLLHPHRALRMQGESVPSP